MKIFPQIVRRVTVQSGGGSNPVGSSVLSEGTPALKAFVATSDPNAAQSETTYTSVAQTLSEASAAQTDAVLASPRGSGFAESSPSPSESKVAVIRYWATAASDNDSSRTTPANATGAANGTVATLKTGLGGVTDTTNPVVLTLGTFGVPSTLTPTQKLIRAYFQVTAAPGSDTITLKYTAGAASGTLFTASAAVNNLANGVTFDVSSLTMAQLAAISVTANYQAAIVLTPSSSLTVDAIAVELLGVF